MSLKITDDNLKELDDFLRSHQSKSTDWYVLNTIRTMLSWTNIVYGLENSGNLVTKFTRYGRRV